MGGHPDWSAFLVERPGTADERSVQILDRLFVGRECPGIDDAHRLLINDRSVSRHHLEIRLDPDRACAFVVDTSTNGTYLDGVRLERAQPTVLKTGSRLTLGRVTMEFRSERFRNSARLDADTTLRMPGLTMLVMVVGDIIDFTAVAEKTPADVLATGLDALFEMLHRLLRKHHGSLANYAGDALFAMWEPARLPASELHAVSFAMEAAEAVAALAPRLPLRAPDGSALSMGWGVSSGAVSVTPLPGGQGTVLGDAANLAFRLGGLAGRSGYGDVLVAATVREVVADQLVFGPGFDVAVKGRQGSATVHEVR